MKISELGPGLYKVRIQKPPPLIRDTRSFPKPTAHLLQVKGHGAERSYKIDNELEVKRDHFVIDEDEFEIVKKLSIPSVDMVRIAITWIDEEGDEYALQTHDTWGIKNLIDEFPFLKGPLNYKARRRPE